MKKWTLFIISILFCFILIGCGETVDDVSYTIKFDSNSNDVFDDITIEKPSTINLPTPTKEGYTFSGWYPNEEYIEGTKVTSTSVLGKNITLHAKWEPTLITINYDLGGGHFIDGTTNKAVQIYTNEEIPLQRVYLDENLFMGWYVEDVEVTEDTRFTKDTTIKALYRTTADLQESYNVSFVMNGENARFYDYTSAPDKAREFIFNYGVLSFSYTEGRMYPNVVTDFTYDFYTFTNSGRRRDFTRQKAFDYTENRLFGNGGFLGNTTYYNKWVWLFEYLYTTANEENKPYLKQLINREYHEFSSDYGVEQIAIRIELAAFIIGSKIEKTINGKTYTSADYSQVATKEGFTSLITATTYITGEGMILLTPLRDGQTFMGWYDNPEFSGEVIREINYNEFGDKTFYAKWEK